MTPDDWTGLSAEEWAEKLAEALDHCQDVLAQMKRDHGLSVDAAGAKLLAEAALASYRAARDAATADGILAAGRMTAEATPDPDGWVPWAGGECPVEPGKMVDVRFRFGGETCEVPAIDWNWSLGQGDHVIVAYRLSRPKTGEVEA